MDLCHVALTAAFVLLLQSNDVQAATCRGRNTVVQMRIPGKTNVTVKYPTNVEPVKFAPFPYKQGNVNPTCYVCNGPQCQQCSTENQNTSPLLLYGNVPVRTNIIIDLQRDKSQSETPNTGNGNTIPTSVTGDNNEATGNAGQEDGTVIALQDSSSAASASNATAIAANSDDEEAAASAAASVAATNTDVIASYEQTNPGDNSNTNTEDIYLQDESQSDAETISLSGVVLKQPSGQGAKQ